MPIRVEQEESSQLLELPVSVERVLRRLLQQPEPERGRFTHESLAQVEREIATEQRDARPDSNEDDIGNVGECAIVVDGDAARRVVLEGLRRRIDHPIEDGEKILFTGSLP